MFPEIPGFGFWEGWIYTAFMVFIIIGIGRDQTRAMTLVRTVATAGLFVWAHFTMFYVQYYDYPSWYPEAATGALLAILFPCIFLLKRLGDQADAKKRREKSGT